MKTWEICRRLLYQNRWLYLLLVLLPPGLAAIVSAGGSAPDLGDVAAILHQQLLYGLVFVVFTASVQLGAEQRSRRAAAVLSRAVSRSRYLLALLYSAWLPLVFYSASLLASAMWLGARMPQPPPGIVALTLNLLLLGLWAAAMGLFFATWLPSFLASAAALALISGTAFLGRVGFGPGQLLGAIIGVAPEAWRPAQRIWDWLMILFAAGAFFAAAADVFNRRDLSLKGE